MAHVVAEVLGRIIENGSGGADGERTVLQAEPVEGQHMELTFEKFLGILDREDPVVQRSPEDRFAGEGEGFRLFPLFQQGGAQEAFPCLESA